MRSKLLIVITIITLIASLSIFVGCSSKDQGATDITSVDNAKLSGVGEEIYEELAYMHEYYTNRTFGGEHELAFAEYVTNNLADNGYKDMIKIYKPFSYHNIVSEKNEELTSRNVVFLKDNPNTDKHVIITSQLDNMYSYEAYANEGVYNGTTGVAIMLELATRLKDVELGYDVYFVGFGANSMMNKGTSVFFDEFYTKNNRSDTLLMVDLTRPIGGDHMYMYCDEMDTKHSDFLYKVAGESGLDFRAVPRDRQIMQGTIYANQPMSYSHEGMISSNIYFLSARVPTVNFISLNWEKKTAGALYERIGTANIRETKLDNFDNFVKLVGKDRIVRESDMVYTLLMNAMTSGEFVGAMQDSINNMPNYTIWSSNGLYYGLWLGIGALLIIGAILISSKLKKKLPSRSMEEFMQDVGMHNGGGPTIIIDPFDSNNQGDNPFDEGNNNGDNNNNDNQKSNKSDGSDDIFGI